MHGMNGFIQIGPEYFQKNMYVNSDVFYVRDNKTVLFCKQSVLTEEKITKLRQIAENNVPIYVSRTGYAQLMRQYQQIKINSSEQTKQFKNVRTEFGGFYESIKNSGKIDMSSTAGLINAVNESLERSDLSFLLQWVSYMRDSDEYLYTHSVNVSILNGMMGKWMKMSKEEVDKLVLAGLLHDVGKTKVQDEILNKPGKLTKEEFEEIKKHPLYSYEILKNSGIEDEELLNGVRWHHEKGNGNGYPDGLILDEISMIARITSISDIYDAMVAKRVYKEAKTPFEVLDEFYRNKFSDLDIRLVDLFLNKMASEMVGKEVTLTDGQSAKIAFVEKSDFAYPVVRCGSRVLHTSKELRCEMLCAEQG